MKASVISLFTGAGGLDLGFEEAGFDIRVCIEINEYACRTIKKNRPSWEVIQRDIKHVSTREILEKAGLAVREATTVTGGPPCQPFSTLGNKKALEDPRGVLFREFIRVVDEAKPESFIFENVPGLKSVIKGSVLKEILEAFTKVGYSTSHGILNAADYGVPQLRKRLFILGHRDGLVLAFPPKTHSKNGTLGRKWPTVGEAFENLINEGWNLERPNNLGMRHSKKMTERMSLIKPGENFWSLPLNKRPACWRNGRHQGKDTFGRIELDRPAPTIRTCAYNPTKGRYIHPLENRGLTTSEMAILQTFPKDYVFEGGLVQVGKQIGDAVPVLLAKRIAEHIKKQLQHRLVHPTLPLLLKQSDQNHKSH